MPPSAVPSLPRAPVRRPSPAALGELVLGLLLGVVGGWVAGLLRAPRR